MVASALALNFSGKIVEAILCSTQILSGVAIIEAISRLRLSLRSPLKVV